MGGSGRGLGLGWSAGSIGVYVVGDPVEWPLGEGVLTGLRWAGLLYRSCFGPPGRPT
jgi:hypothetical protein